MCEMVDINVVAMVTLLFPHRKLYYLRIGIFQKKKMAGDLHRTAQPPTLATFRSWGSSAGAGRVRPAGANIRKLT
jgi:hypothetical protein